MNLIDDDEGFCSIVDRRKAFCLISSRGLLSEILTIANLRHTASKILNSAEPEFRLSWMKLCSSDNPYATAPVKSPVERKGACPSLEDNLLRLTERHLNNIKQNNPITRCIVCDKHKIRRESRCECKQCNAHLCVAPCFEKHHTRKAFWKFLYYRGCFYIFSDVQKYYRESSK